MKSSAERPPTGLLGPVDVGAAGGLGDGRGQPLALGARLGGVDAGRRRGGLERPQRVGEGESCRS